MREPGYSSYHDPNLQPPPEQDVTPQETMERCNHCNACLRLCAMLYDGEADQWEVMQCSECDEWEE